MPRGVIATNAHHFQVFSRSEEHTSELQSQSNLVCRLLLEKKKSNIDRLMTTGSSVRLAESGAIGVGRDSWLVLGADPERPELLLGVALTRLRVDVRAAPTL